MDDFKTENYELLSNCRFLCKSVKKLKRNLTNKKVFDDVTAVIVVSSCLYRWFKNISSTVSDRTLRLIYPLPSHFNFSDKHAVCFRLLKLKITVIKVNSGFNFVVIQYSPVTSTIQEN